MVSSPRAIGVVVGMSAEIGAVIVMVGVICGDVGGWFLHHDEEESFLEHLQQAELLLEWLEPLVVLLVGWFIH